MRFAGILLAAACLSAADSSLNLDHFKLRVSSVDVSASFYYSLFGCQMKEMRGGSVLTAPETRAIVLKIGTGGTYMILSQPEAKAPIGLEHIATDHAGLVRASQSRIAQSFPDYIRDPAGNLIEFVGPTPFERIRAQAPPLPTAAKPAFEPVAIRQITLGVSDVRRAAGFYRIFGTELTVAARKDLRAFDFGGTVLGLSSKPAKSGLDGITIAIRNFDAASALRALRERGIHAVESRTGAVTFRDPDGNKLELVAE